MKTEAVKSGDYETGRDLDLYEAYIKKDLMLFKKIYFGTQYASYRLKMKVLFKIKNVVKHENKFIFQTSEDNKIPVEIFQPMGLSLTPMSKLLLKIIFTDFYRPIHLGEVFRQLYPNEFFNPNSSKDRLYRVFLKLKKEVIKCEAPIDIFWKNNQIGWAYSRSFILSLEEKSVNENKSALFFSQLPDRFSIYDFKNAIGKSRRTSERWIRQWLDEKIIKKTKPGFFTKR